MIKIKRFLMTDRATYGVLYIDKDVPLCVTLELPWKDNQRNVSCIPDGKYGLAKHNGTIFKNVFRLENVPNRTAILIHKGNTTADIQGCILVGTSFWGQGVAQSAKALEKVRPFLEKSNTIVIENP